MNLSYGIPLRGAITKGDVFIEKDVFVGKAIVDAYLMEQQQEWVGCWVADDCVSEPVAAAAATVLSNALVQYRIPLKSGRVRSRWAVNWASLLMLRNEDLEVGVRSRFFLDDPTSQDAPWEVERKIRNTLAFLQHVGGVYGAA
jgi:hypothetical protein